MDAFRPGNPQNRQPPSPEPPEPSSGNSVNWLYVLLVVLIVAGAAFHGYQRWKKSHAPPPPPKEEPEKKKGKKEPPPTPVIQVGDTRARALEILGEPRGVSRLKNQETLVYSNGQVVIENDVVVSVEMGKGRQKGVLIQQDKQVTLREGGRIEQRAAP